MKRIIVLTLLSAMAVCTYAQDIHQKNVPAVILNAFQLKFANAEDIDWELNKGIFEVEFEFNGKDNKIWMDDRGKIIKHEQNLWQSEVPVAIIEAVRGKCKYFDLDDAERTEEGGRVTYYVDFEVDNKDCHFWIDEKGEILKFKRELKDNQIPASILASIKGQYASFDIDDAELLEEAGKTIYFLDVEIDDKEHNFWYDGSGKMLKHKEDLRNSAIPAAVMTAISSMFPGYDIRDANKITEDGNTIFEILLRKSKDNVRVIFNPLGELVKSTAQ